MCNDGNNYSLPLLYILKNGGGGGGGAVPHSIGHKSNCARVNELLNDVNVCALEAIDFTKNSVGVLAMRLQFVCIVLRIVKRW